MKLLTSELDKNVTFKLAANIMYPELQITVTWVMIEASENDIKEIYPNDVRISQSWLAIKKAKQVGDNIYVIPLVHVADCTTSIHDIFGRNFCPTITPVELKYLFEHCADSYKSRLFNLDNVLLTI